MKVHLYYNPKDFRSHESENMQPNIEATQLWIAMNLATHKIYRKIDATMKKEGLPTLKWYDVLWELEQNIQGLRPHEIADKLLFEQSNLSKLLKRMHEEKLVNEIIFEGDRRGRVIQITQAGSDVRRKMSEIYRSLIHENIGKIIDRENCNKTTQILRLLAQ